MDFCPWYTFNPQKSDHCTLFFGANGKGTSHVDTATTTLQLTVQSRNCFAMTQRVHSCSCSRNEQRRKHNNVKKYIADTL
jgi:hypothetical protein